MTSSPRLFVLACGALAREVLALVRLNGWTHVDVRCLPARLHLVPDEIPAAVDARLAEVEGRYDRVFVAYADCGTQGRLDDVLAVRGAERLGGLHCYGFFAGNGAWEAMQDVGRPWRHGWVWSRGRQRPPVRWPERGRGPCTGPKEGAVNVTNSSGLSATCSGTLLPPIRPARIIAKVSRA